jgi:hypothetical protein
MRAQVHAAAGADRRRDAWARPRGARGTREWPHRGVRNGGALHAVFVCFASGLNPRPRHRLTVGLPPPPPPPQDTQLRGAIGAMRECEERLLTEGDVPHARHGSHKSAAAGRCACAAFEQALVRGSVEYYTALGQDLASRCAPTDFMEGAEAVLQTEREMAVHWLPEGSRSLATCSECCHIALVYAHRELMNSCIPRLLRENKRPDLRRLYRLLKPAQGLPALQRALRRHVEECGVELLRTMEASAAERAAGGGRARPGAVDPATAATRTATTAKASRGYAEALWRLLERSKGVVRDCCDGDLGCAHAVDRCVPPPPPKVFFVAGICHMQGSVLATRLKSATNRASGLRTVVNAAERPAEALARFCHSVLSVDKRKAGDSSSSSSSSSNPLEQRTAAQLTMASDLVRYIDDKDAFMHLTRRLLARRLIQGSSSMEAEQRMLSLLQPHCGWDFVMRLQRMCADSNLAPALRARFREWRHAGADGRGHTRAVPAQHAALLRDPRSRGLTGSIPAQVQTAAATAAEIQHHAPVGLDAVVVRTEAPRSPRRGGASARSGAKTVRAICTATL